VSTGAPTSRSNHSPHTSPIPTPIGPSDSTQQGAHSQTACRLSVSPTESNTSHEGFRRVDSTQRASSSSGKAPEQDQPPLIQIELEV
jgi:hypothetical protein